MIQASQLKLDTRLIELQAWLRDDVELDYQSVTTASADASFRRYFRVHTQTGSLIAMDAPPDKEDCQPFILATQRLRSLGVHAPEIYAYREDKGFILLEDLGRVDYLSALRDSGEAARLYADAIDALHTIQSGSTDQVSLYSRQKLTDEMGLFLDWYLSRHLNVKLTAHQQRVWQETQNLLLNVCSAQPQVLVHRDYHSRNLMHTSQNNPGVIDYQDMVVGPITYDLASIFKDCYIEWPRAQQLEWLRMYFDLLESPSFSIDELIRWYDLTGLQRHLKVLGVFCRLHYRDGKSQYLDDLPLVAKYCLEVFDLYSELIAFKHEFSLMIERAMAS